MTPSFRGKKSRGRRSLPPDAARRGCPQANVELVRPIPARRRFKRCPADGGHADEYNSCSFLFTGLHSHTYSPAAVPPNVEELFTNTNGTKMFQEQELKNCRLRRRSQSDTFPLYAAASRRISTFPVC